MIVLEYMGNCDWNLFHTWFQLPHQPIEKIEPGLGQTLPKEMFYVNRSISLIAAWEIQKEKYCTLLFLQKDEQYILAFLNFLQLTILHIILHWVLQFSIP